MYAIVVGSVVEGRAQSLTSPVNTTDYDVISVSGLVNLGLGEGDSDGGGA